MQAGTVFGKNLQWVIDNGLDNSKVELCGVSLGAQLVGEMAKHTKIEVLVALDPASADFDKFLPRVRKGFAKHTIGIHADRYAMGTRHLVGDIDFLVNDGTGLQPGCPLAIFLPDLCSHTQVELWYGQSLLKPQLFIGTKCNYFAFCRLGCNLTDLAMMSPDTR